MEVRSWKAPAFSFWSFDTFSSSPASSRKLPVFRFSGENRASFCACFSQNVNSQFSSFPLFFPFTRLALITNRKSSLRFSHLACTIFRIEFRKKFSHCSSSNGDDFPRQIFQDQVAALHFFGLAPNVTLFHRKLAFALNDD